MASGGSHTTTDHEVIRHWIEERGGQPSTVKGTEGSGEAGILRIDFPGRGEDERLEHISWEAFFEKFDDADLAFVYQDETAEGQESRFGKFVRR
jgi:hypothetical protein